jgi:hypothetical protein
MSHNNASGLNKMDVLFVGAGPASLAGAIRLKQLLKAKGRKGMIRLLLLRRPTRLASITCREQCLRLMSWRN